jgi:hypothetical protein
MKAAPRRSARVGDGLSVRAWLAIAIAVFVGLSTWDVERRMHARQLHQLTDTRKVVESRSHRSPGPPRVHRDRDDAAAAPTARPHHESAHAGGGTARYVRCGTRSAGPRGADGMRVLTRGAGGGGRRGERVQGAPTSRHPTTASPPSSLADRETRQREREQREKERDEREKERVEQEQHTVKVCQILPGCTAG